jgi:hypothetical protein
MGGSAVGRAEAPASDTRLTAVGAACGLLLAVPGALANVALAAREPRPRLLLNLTLLALVAGFALAGLVAARETRTDRVRRGVLAALAVFVAVEVIGVLGRLDRDRPVSVVGIVFVGLVAAGAGYLGARLGASRPPRPDHGGPAGDDPAGGAPGGPVARPSSRP